AVFRKAAIDRLTSPDELAEVLQFTRPFDWLMLCAIALMLAAGLAWGALGRVQVTEQGAGLVAASEGGGRATALLLVRAAAVDRIRPGQRARLKLLSRPHDRVLPGTVIRTHPAILGDDEIRRAVAN